MAYLDSNRRPSAASMAAVIAIHGAVGAALILGLTVSGVIVPKAPPVTTWDDPIAPPPPPPTPEPDQPKAEAPKRDVHVPIPPIPIPKPGPEIDTTEQILPPLPPVPRPGPSETAREIIPTPTPSFAAVAARPRNDPARWVTEADYRGDWVRREMTGRARFRLEIAATGRVESCTITGSSGHPALDEATCALVSRRARFQPARGTEGQPVGGSYVNTIDWRLPE